MNINNIYTVETEKIPSKPGCWDVLNCKIFQTLDGIKTQIGEYPRRYSTFFHTFHPFELNGKHLALYSSDYTATRILSLPDCTDIGGEEGSTYGFCPVDYYVPYYIVEMFNGSELIHHIHPQDTEDNDCLIIRQGYQPFGFVAGCIWGDDSSWKIEFLDLSQADKGIIVRDNRFGYLEMPEKIERLHDCINLSCYENENHDFIRISFEKTFHLNGSPENGNYAKNANAIKAIEELKSDGYSFAYWDVCNYSSAPGHVAAFCKGVTPPTKFHYPHDEGTFVGYGESFAEAVLNAAKYAHENSL